MQTLTKQVRAVPLGAIRYSRFSNYPRCSVRHWLVSLLALGLASCGTTVQEEYQSTKRANSVEKYDAFLAKYPNSDFAADARERRDKAIEAQRRTEVKDKNRLALNAIADGDSTARLTGQTLFVFCRLQLIPSARMSLDRAQWFLESRSMRRALSGSVIKMMGRNIKVTYNPKTKQRTVNAKWVFGYPQDSLHGRRHGVVADFRMRGSHLIKTMKPRYRQYGGCPKAPDRPKKSSRPKTQSK